MSKYKSFGAFGVIISTVFLSIYNVFLFIVLTGIFYAQVLLAGAHSYKMSAIKTRVKCSSPEFSGDGS